MGRGFLHTDPEPGGPGFRCPLSADVTLVDWLELPEPPDTDRDMEVMTVLPSWATGRLIQVAENMPRVDMGQASQRLPYEHFLLHPDNRLVKWERLVLRQNSPCREIVTSQGHTAGKRQIQP